jgi:hypothetical protein
MRPLTVKGTPRQREYVTNRVKRGTSLADRILHHSKEDAASGCWVWQLKPTPRTGYGHLTVDRKVLIAHRVSYEQFVGPIPDGLQLDHLCRNRACVNPAHLEPVTALENNHRSPLTHANKTHCPNGHEYDFENTYRCKGRRQCKACRDVRLALWRAMTPARASRAQGRRPSGRRPPRILRCPEAGDGRMSLLDVLSIAAPPAWSERAGCAQPGIDPDLFFPAPGQARVAEAAKQVCAACPVSTPCLEFALRFAQGHQLDAGIYGGLTAAQRRTLRQCHNAGCRRLASPRRRYCSDTCLAAAKQRQRHEYDVRRRRGAA